MKDDSLRRFIIQHMIDRSPFLKQIPVNPFKGQRNFLKRLNMAVTPPTMKTKLVFRPISLKGIDGKQLDMTLKMTRRLQEQIEQSAVQFGHEVMRFTKALARVRKEGDS